MPAATVLDVPSYQLRPFLPSDHAQALALWMYSPGVGVRANDDSAEGIARFLQRNPGLSFVAMDGGAMVGTILCGHDGRRGVIYHLVVAPSARRQGVGRALLRAGLSALQAEGIARGHLFAFQGNAEGLAFWRGVQATERTDLAMFSFNTDSAAWA